MDNTHSKNKVIFLNLQQYGWKEWYQLLKLYTFR
jgi:hypothetical protein